jgi:effector-binding domain-containing protein
MAAAPSVITAAPSVPAKPAKPAKAPQVDLVELTAQPMIWRRRETTDAALADDLTKAVLDLVAYAAANGIDLAGPPVARYQVGPHTIAVEVGLPVIKAPAKVSGDVSVGELPAGPAATLTFVGRHEDLPGARAALAAWLGAHHRVMSGPAWEVYLTNPLTTRDPTKQKTKLFAPLDPP